MKKKVVGMGLCALSALLVFNKLSLPSASEKLISPLAAHGLPAINLWFPRGGKRADNLTIPIISAKAAYFVDGEIGQILYQKDPHLRLPIASLTKIMTVIVTLENRDWNDTVLISSKAAEMEPDKMELIAGERLTIEELLEGIFLVSANDAAEALADTTLGSREEFIKQMNGKAQQLGMKDTLFINPTGLEEDDKSQYSSAYDVALMSRYALKQFPRLLTITSQPHIFLPPTSTHQDYDLYSGINLLTTYPGVVGLKTGYTQEAGLTLVTVAKKDGHEVIGVILGSGDRRGEAKELLDYSFDLLNLK